MSINVSLEMTNHINFNRYTFLSQTRITDLFIFRLYLPWNVIKKDIRSIIPVNISHVSQGLSIVQTLPGTTKIQKRQYLLCETNPVTHLP